MARPVKDTPVLEGKEAKAFEQQIKRNEANKASQKEKNRVLANFNKIKITCK